MAWQRRKEIPKCFACGRNPVDAKSVTEYERTDECLCAECAKLENPYNKPDECRLCTLFRRPGPVFHRGKPNKEMLYVAEAPGAEEAKYGVRLPLVGGSGKVHDRICQFAGFDSNDYRHTNCVKCKPEHNRKPTDFEIRACARYLIEEIETLDPNIIVALGDTALYVLTGKTGIHKHRGVPLEGFGGRKVLATLHPAFVMRDQSKFAMPIYDIIRAREESKFREIRRVEVRYNPHASNGDLRHSLLERARRVGVSVEDIETHGVRPDTYEGALDPHVGQIVCWGYGDGTPGHGECYRWSPDLAKVVTEIHLDPTIEKVGQNCEGFDWWFMLENAGIPEPVGKSFDTMLAFHLTNPDFPKDLGTIGTFYTDMEYWKDGAKKDLFWYNCQDIDGTARAYQGLKKELEQLDMTSLYYDHVMPLQPILRRMRKRGIKKNQELAAKYILGLTMKANELEATLREGLGDPTLNVMSSPQLQALIYGKMGLPKKWKRTKAGMRPTLDADALEELAKEYPNLQIIQLISQIRTIRSKWISTYLAVPTDEFDFVHPSFGSGKAATGRLNSWNPNFQNIPRELREIYIPDTPEHVIIAADWSQIEWRLGMILSGDPVGLEALVNGVDNHAAAWSAIYGMRVEDVTSEQRDTAKFTNYGLIYGRGAESLALEHNKPVTVFEDYLRGFARKYRVYWQWRDDLVRFARENFYLQTAFKRRRFWYTRQITEMYNFPLQSTAADMMYRAIIDCERELPKESTIRATVHDELVTVAPKDQVREAVECIRENMQRKWDLIVEASARPDIVKKFYPNGWHCPVDIHLGNNWYESKKGNKELERSLLG